METDHQESRQSAHILLPTAVSLRPISRQQTRLGERLHHLAANELNDTIEYGLCDTVYSIQWINGSTSASTDHELAMVEVVLSSLFPLSVKRWVEQPLFK